MGLYLKFLWIAFREYWVSWVCGAGAVGFLLWLLGFTQIITGWKMKPKVYIVVLFCTLWFVGTFSAWHDSERNLTNVIAQRANDNANLGNCRSNLQAQRVLTESWQARFSDQQNTINNLHAPQLQQQALINRCVIDLGRMNPVLNTKIDVLAIPVGVETNGTVETHVFEMLIMTNRKVDPRGRLKCPQAFMPSLSPQITNRNSGLSVDQPAIRISDREYDIRVSNSGGDWEQNSPIYFLMRSASKAVGVCSFTLQ